MSSLAPKMYLFSLRRVYKAEEGFTLEAPSLEEAERMVENGDWDAERDYDEYLEILEEVLEPYEVDL